MLALAYIANAQQPYSIQGRYALPNTGREMYSFNNGWRFKRDSLPVSSTGILPNTSKWSVVSLPHTVELVPQEASGSINYQGSATYAKVFTLPQEMQGKKLFLSFEAIMGKSKIWVNGKLVKEHFGGYLPINIDLTDLVNFDKENTIVVLTDNSNDPIFPPGKPQNIMDFCYFGGIYRDAWLVATNPVYITDPNTVDKVAGGGVFFRISQLSQQEATVTADINLKNESTKNGKYTIEQSIVDKNGKVVANAKKAVSIAANSDAVASLTLKVKNPNMWSPKSPTLYRLNTIVKDGKGKVLDGFSQRIGLRTIAFDAKQGLILNGKPYDGKLMGANRHQDFAYVGNALPNSGQWRDAKKLKEAGFEIVRSAHYPQDPAFMDACDELGLFVIVATPGWQFWNKAPIFEQRIYSDIRQMVRRDRNHACVLMWEPILNETWYPKSFAENANKYVKQEDPYNGYTACDNFMEGRENYDVLYSHPFLDNKFDEKGNITEYSAQYGKINKPLFTREYGDNVDDWNAHNSTSRASVEWGEKPQLVQALHYLKPPYDFTCVHTLQQAPAQHFGGALWHPFDHQRGYHPDPFYGGIMDMFRLPKTSFYAYKSQVDASVKQEGISSGPMVYIANEMTPFSEKDITVFINCDSVHLVTYRKATNPKQTSYNPAEAKKITFTTDTLSRVPLKTSGIKHDYVVFEDAYDFMIRKAMHRNGKQNDAFFEAIGYVDGKVAVREKKYGSNRPAQIRLEVDTLGRNLMADGSDLVTVVAYITDDRGSIKRLNNMVIHLEVTGEGELIDDGNIEANPKKVEWGRAPFLIRSTTKAGKIRIKATIQHPSKNQPTPVEITLESVPSPYRSIYKAGEVNTRYSVMQDRYHKEQEQIDPNMLKEVEKQQSDFENQHK